MLDPFTQSQFLLEHNLVTWCPNGILDFEMASMMVQFVGFQERVFDDPFDRFADWSGLTGVQLCFLDITEFVTIRRDAHGDGPPVRSAFFATDLVTYGMARMFSMLMERSPIHVQVFRLREAAAEWLGVPVDALGER